MIQFTGYLHPLLICLENLLLILVHKIDPLSCNINDIDEMSPFNILYYYSWQRLAVKIDNLRRRSMI